MTDERSVTAGGGARRETLTSIWETSLHGSRGHPTAARNEGCTVGLGEIMEDRRGAYLDEDPKVAGEKKAVRESEIMEICAIKDLAAKSDSSLFI
ncbi:hypothetical protein Syun_015387 [Stephania yunnanensis]|uniref:Uncharacterized protein n=1 Tax=Stephania yunnanensis TaxID=152371 RepID=A0AAP0P9N7_9MAGN